MDCNSYSYAPTMLDDDTILKDFSNDDMYMSLEKDKHYDHYIYYVNANSYGPGLEVAEVYNSQETAEKLYNFIFENYTTTPPGEELQDFIDTLK